MFINYTTVYTAQSFSTIFYNSSVSYIKLVAQAIKHMAVGIMDLRNYFSRNRSRNEESCDQEELAKVDSASKDQALDDAPEEASVKSKAQRKKVYKARLTYRKEWEEKYPWVY